MDTKNKKGDNSKETQKEKKKDEKEEEEYEDEGDNDDEMTIWLICKAGTSPFCSSIQGHNDRLISARWRGWTWRCFINALITLLSEAASLYLHCFYDSYALPCFLGEFSFDSAGCE